MNEICFHALAVRKNWVLQPSGCLIHPSGVKIHPLGLRPSGWIFSPLGWITAFRLQNPILPSCSARNYIICVEGSATVQCGNLAIFSQFRFLREINFGWFKKIKSFHFNHFGGFEFIYFTWKCQKLPEIQYSELQNCQNGRFWGIKMTKNAKLISRKNLSGRKIATFPHCD